MRVEIWLILGSVVLFAVWGFLIRRWWGDYHSRVTDREASRGTPRRNFRRFYGVRTRDISGVSGTGTPVEGVMFSDGWVVTHWLDKAPMFEPKTDVWHNRGAKPFERVHGHGGATKVVWVDD